MVGRLISKPRCGSGSSCQAKAKFPEHGVDACHLYHENRVRRFSDRLDRLPPSFEELACTGKRRQREEFNRA